MLLSACTAGSLKVATLDPATITAPVVVFTATARPTATPPAKLTPHPQPTPTLEKLDSLTIWIAPSVPDGLRSKLHLPAMLKQVDLADNAQLKLEPVSGQAETSGVYPIQWIYAVVAPFPTVLDGVDLADVQDAWFGKPFTVFGGKPLLMAEPTRLALEAIWGPAQGASIKVVDSQSLLQQAWDDQPAWAIVPFDELEPRWKVLHLNGIDLLDKQFNPSTYPLEVGFDLVGDGQYLRALTIGGIDLQGLAPQTNRDASKLTVLVMTGTTALTRHTAYTMETEGVLYPARDIGDWLRDADLTHISNEVSFDPTCPPAAPLDEEMRFCSSPTYLDLLKDIHANVIELTGNHLVDWGIDPLTFTLGLYQQNNFSYYGGGANLDEARKPLFIENHGNRLAFLGCNSTGPANDWATAEQPGSNPCDMDAFEKQIIAVKAQGYLPVVTFQHFEYGTFDGYKPQSGQRVDFLRMSAAGAVIVSGSQAHYPLAKTFVGQNFVDYGLGNLFFDQMVDFARPEFIDRHVFYDGRYISTELLTAMLEDYARPRPMTPEERVKLLTDIFAASDWNQK
jgi:poly-gamma-glutamate synthesis protein (capsule biosynthesis protein)